VQAAQEKIDALRALRARAREIALAEDLPGLFTDEAFWGRIGVLVEMLRDAAAIPSVAPPAGRGKV
jgi:hypothetical protein